MNRFVARAHYRLHFRVKKLLRVPRKLDVTYTFASKQHTLDDLLARSRTQGFLVIKDGKIVDERYFNGANDKSKFTSWSVAKSFTSTLVGLALADGKIKSIDEPVTNYLPELKGSGYEGVPIKDVLEMSSGVKFNEEYGKNESDVMIMWRKTMDEESETFADYARSLGRAEAPGTKFVYRSVDTAVLGMLVKRVAGESLADMLSQRIWQPLGMESDATWLTDHPGAGALEAAYCCINARLRDYGRFGAAPQSRQSRRATDRPLVVGRAGDHSAKFAGSMGPSLSRISRLSRRVRLSMVAYRTRRTAFVLGRRCVLSVRLRDAGVNTVITKASAYDDYWSVPLQLEQFAAFDAIGRALEKN